MRLNCPQCDHVITGNECDCGFRYVNRQPQQLELPVTNARRREEGTEGAPLVLPYVCAV